jgi:flagellar basal body rod protein FlgC
MPAIHKHPAQPPLTPQLHTAAANMKAAEKHMAVVAANIGNRESIYRMR